MPRVTSIAMKTSAGTVPDKKRAYQGFAAPEDILVDHALDAAERRRLLETWRHELANASHVDVAGRPQDLLRRLNTYRRLLNEEYN